MELIHAMVERYQGISVFAGIGERSREGHELWSDMQELHMLGRTAMVFGQITSHLALSSVFRWPHRFSDVQYGSFQLNGSATPALRSSTAMASH